METDVRYSVSDKKKNNAPMPVAIAEYNSHIGGVDLCDQFLAKYRSTIRYKNGGSPILGGTWMYQLYRDDYGIENWDTGPHCCKISKCECVLYT